MCTEEEKRDAANNVMAACQLGCDALFERGYIGLDTTGHVIITKPGDISDSLATALDDLRGRQLNNWTSENAPYAQWHRQNKLRPGDLTNSEAQ